MTPTQITWTIPRWKTARGEAYEAAVEIWGILLLICVLGLIVFRALEKNLVYFPYRPIERTPKDVGLAFEDIQFKSSDGLALHGWFFPVASDTTRSNRVVLICHGNAGNVAHRIGISEALVMMGLNVFVFDYRGYGRSEGKPDEEGTYRDAQAAHAWLVQKGFRAEDIIPYGESLGGGVASELALREKIGGLILQSTFTSIPDIGKELYPWLPVRLINTIKYHTLSKLPKIQVPVLIIHSPADEIVPFRHGKRLFEAANQPKLFCQLSSGHNDAVYEEEFFNTSLMEFLKLLEK